MTEAKIPTLPMAAEWHDVGVGDKLSMSFCSLRLHLQLWPKSLSEIGRRGEEEK